MYITSLSVDGTKHYETVPCKPVALHVLPLQSDNLNVPKWICCMIIKQAFEYKTMGICLGIYL